MNKSEYCKRGHIKNEMTSRGLNRQCRACQMESVRAKRKGEPFNEDRANRIYRELLTGSYVSRGKPYEYLKPEEALGPLPETYDYSTPTKEELEKLQDAIVSGVVTKSLSR